MHMSHLILMKVNLNHIRVPVEQNDHTMKVELDVPKGLNVESVKPIEGFKHHFLKIKKGTLLK